MEEEKGERVASVVVFGSKEEEEEEKVLTEETAGEVKRREARNRAATITLWYLAMLLLPLQDKLPICHTVSLGFKVSFLYSLELLLLICTNKYAFHYHRNLLAVLPRDYKIDLFYKCKRKVKIKNKGETT